MGNLQVILSVCTAAFSLAMTVLSYIIGTIRNAKIKKICKTTIEQCKAEKEKNNQNKKSWL